MLTAYKISNYTARLNVNVATVNPTKIHMQLHMSIAYSRIGKF